MKSLGSIPACAGETRPSECIPEIIKVHPRVRGGDRRARASANRAIGPSPRARGRRPQHPEMSGRNRSIPACAGETGWLTTLRNHQWVHPRVRGGDRSLVVPFRVGKGPSPRARGRRAVSMPCLKGGRSIPACAGETPAPGAGSRACAVHPRVRGGDVIQGMPRIVTTGPSPRARGRLLGRMIQEHPDGSIPACAGETPPMSGLFPLPGVHPRVRGGDKPC